MQRWVYVLFAVVVAVAIVGGLALTGLPPFAHPSSSASPDLLSFEAASSVARTGSAAHPAPTWSLVSARGFITPVSYSVPWLSLWAAAGENLTCAPPQFPGGGSFTIPGIPPGWNSGVAPSWLFAFATSSTTSFAVVAVVAGAPVPMWTVDASNPDCPSPGVPPSATSLVVDSPTAAGAAWTRAGAAFVQSHGNVSEVIDVANGSYAIHYDACDLGGPGTVAELTVVVNGATGAVSSATNGSEACQASSGLPAGGTTPPPSPSVMAEIPGTPRSLSRFVR
ncbi:MAG: hypothetical protein L3K17_08565 [Thermoplasmata archaeon]|nr:hypothetical protein [Thermoplasmata archaeon]